MLIMALCRLLCTRPDRLADKCAFHPQPSSYTLQLLQNTISSNTFTGATADHPQASTATITTAACSQGVTAAAASKTGQKFTMFSTASPTEQPGRAEALRETMAVTDVMVAQTARGNHIVVAHIRCCTPSTTRCTLLHSHGNSVDIGQMVAYYRQLGTILRCNVVGYDYSGYGASTGAPSETNLYADAEAAWQIVHTRLAIPPDRIVLYGTSIGTVSTVDLATRHRVAGVILQAGLASGVRVFCPRFDRMCCMNPFPSISKVSKIDSPVLVIHGTDDEVIDISHGEALYQQCQHPVDPLWIEGAGHSDIEMFSEFWQGMDRFITKVCGSTPQCVRTLTDDLPG